jgi:plastocyanin
MKNLKIFLTTIIMGTALIVSQHAYATGNVSGVITYEGEVPKFREIKMDADPICLSQHTESVFPQTLVLGPDKTMADVFVHITKGLPQGAQYPAPPEPVVIDQQGCMYDPHVVGVLVGQPVKVLNPDGTLHNVHALSKINPEFNLAMPKFRKETIKIFDKAEFMFPIKCDVHPWMAAWVAVMEHPFYDVTEEDGRYLLKDVPAGEYEIEAWHEKLGSQKATVSVKEGSSNQINFSFSR